MAEPRDPEPLDTVPLAEVVDRTLAAQAAALEAVRAVAADVAAAADLVAGRFAAGGRLLLLAGPGAAARLVELATADWVREFGFADGAVLRWSGAGDDGVRPTSRDAVLVLALDPDDLPGPGLAAATRAGAGVVLVATTGAAVEADVVVRPEPGRDVVSGLPRLAAATAAKAVLDAVTTAVATVLGHVHGDLPVDLVPASDADREHVVRMVAAATGVDAATARAASERTDHDVRAAVIGLAAGLDPAGAARHAAAHRTLREALQRLPAPFPDRGAPPAGPPARMGP